MERQTRILLGDIGDHFAVNAAFAFRKAGDWAVTRRQTHDDMLQSLRFEHPDVLILNLTVPTMHFPHFTEEVQQLSELPVFALCQKKEPYMERLLEQLGVRCIPFPENASVLVGEIHCLSGIPPARQEVPASDPETEVTKLLHSFGIPSNLRGFYYLRTAILIAAEKPTCSGIMMNQIYPAVAEEVHSTPTRVERAIRHAILQAWENNDGRFSWHFGQMKDHRMTNSEFIAFTVDWIRTEGSRKLCG